MVTTGQMGEFRSFRLLQWPYFLKIQSSAHLFMESLVKTKTLWLDTSPPSSADLFERRAAVAESGGRDQRARPQTLDPVRQRRHAQGCPGQQQHGDHLDSHSQTVSAEPKPLEHCFSPSKIT